jgi:4'-phosphopantetheinyl transferase
MSGQEKRYTSGMMDDLKAEWLPGSSAVFPEESVVHIWRIRLDCPSEQTARLAGLLAPDEQARAARYRIDEVRREFIVGRAALRILLAGYLGIEPRAVAFAYEERGRPILAQSQCANGLCFNLSNARVLALAAFTRGRQIGIDLESNKRRVELNDVAARFFAPSERTALFDLPLDRQRQAFFNCWTRKESYLKARGMGLSRPLDRFAVSLAPGEPARLLSDASDPDAPGHWSLVSVDRLPGYTAALAVEGAITHIDCYDFLFHPEHF